MKRLNAQLACLSRVVLHPTYRGAGLTSRFIQKACELSGMDWVEALSQIGHVNPLFERAGFTRVGVCEGPKRRTRAGHSAVYGKSKRRRQVSEETFEKSQRSQPVYYVWGRGGVSHEAEGCGTAVSAVGLQR